MGTEDQMLRKISRADMALHVCLTPIPDPVLALLSESRVQEYRRQASGSPVSVSLRTERPQVSIQL